MKIRYHCHFNHLTGYGRAARDYLMALTRHTDLDVEIIPFSDSGKELEPRYEELLDYVVDAPSKGAGIDVYHASAQALAANKEWYGGIAMTTWEVRGVPKAIGDGLDRYQKIIVPSEFCCSALLAHDDVVIVPHCYDPDFWERKEIPHDLYRFYYVGAFSERKNVAGVIKAYFHAFTIDDPVELVLACPGASVEQLAVLITASGIDRKKLPRLSFSNEELSEDQLLELHQGGDCFVSATRGEGFGLGAFEATVMGNYTLVPGFGGQRDFVGGRLVDFCYTPVYGGIVLGDGQVALDRIPGVTCQQKWAEPNLIDMSEAMRAIASQRPESYAEDLRSFTYETIGPKLEKVICAKR